MNHSSEQRRTRELVYISFSYDDDEFRNELREVLLNDIRLSASVWDDRMLPEGEDWEERIHAHVARARIMIMLVSNSYLDPQCQAWKFEIPQAIEAHKKGVLTIMWLAVRAVRVSDTPFPEIQATLPVSRPLEGLDFEARQMAYNLLRLKIREKLGIGTSGAFDVFISHNSKDKERVRELCEKLKRRGIEVWLDEEQLQPGMPWQHLLEQGIRSSTSVAVLVGNDGLGPWEDEEMQGALRLAANDKRPVLPILLPDAPAQPKLPMFLINRTWVDLRDGLTEEKIDNVVWGITGKKPRAAVGRTEKDISDASTRRNQGIVPTDTTATATPSYTDPNQKTVRWAIVFSAEFNAKERARVEALLEQLRKLTEDPRLTIVATERGSVRLILEGSLRGYERAKKFHVENVLGEVIGLEVCAVKRLQLVILVHGIRTRAEWNGRIQHLLQADGMTEVVSIGYGYFDVFRFLFPFGTRRGPIKEVLRKIRDALAIHESEKREVIMVGHSFGSYVLGTILDENPDIRPDRLLLCGSILTDEYRWDKLPNRPKDVLNEAGSKDIWPILAKSITWGYGSTGTFGFQTPGVRDRFHNLAHSDYFKAGFAEKYWLPWFNRGECEPTSYETGERPPTPLLKNLIEVIPLKWVIIILFLLAGIVIAASRTHSKGTAPPIKWSVIDSAHVPDSLSELRSVLSGDQWPLEGLSDVSLEKRRQGYEPKQQFVGFVSSGIETRNSILEIKLRDECENDLFLGTYLLRSSGDRLKVVEGIVLGPNIVFKLKNSGKCYLVILVFPTSAKGDTLVTVSNSLLDCLVVRR